MIYSNVMVPVLVAALSILPAACAPQPTAMASPPSMTSLAGPANPGIGAAPMQGMPNMGHSNMPGMTEMDHSGMQGMDMNTMMAHCSQMQQQMRADTAVSADMRQMMNQCDQMDRTMGATSGR